jgi:hypothetical protein
MTNECHQAPVPVSRSRRDCSCSSVRGVFGRQRVSCAFACVSAHCVVRGKRDQSSVDGAAHAHVYSYARDIEDRRVFCASVDDPVHSRVHETRDQPYACGDSLATANYLDCDIQRRRVACGTSPVRAAAVPLLTSPCYPAPAPAHASTSFDASTSMLLATFAWPLARFRIDEVHLSARQAGDAHKDIVGPFRYVVVGSKALHLEARIGAAVDEGRHRISRPAWSSAM